MDLNVQFSMPRLHCYEESDGPGDAEPFLWVVFFKIDGDSVSVQNGRPVGTATIYPRSGNHEDLSSHDVGAGDDVGIPQTLGSIGLVLKPIPVNPPIFGVTEISGAFGCLAILLEQDATEDSRIAKGHDALNKAVKEALDALIPTLTMAPSAEQIQALEAQIVDAVFAALGKDIGVLEFLDGLIHFGNMDDVVGKALFLFTHDELAKLQEQGAVKEVSQWWTETRRVTTSWTAATVTPVPVPTGAFTPGDYDAGAGTMKPTMVSTVRLPAAGWTATLYPEKGFQGTPVVVSREIQLVQPRVYNGIRVAEPKPVVYTGTNFQGTNMTLEARSYDVGDIAAVGNDQIASIRVPFGWRVRAYSEAGFWGDSVLYDKDTVDVGTVLGRRISSLVVTRSEPSSDDGDYELFGRVSATRYVPPPKQLITGISPSPAPNQPSTVTVTATDAQTGAPVAGRVLINGVDVAATNAPFGYTFRAKRVKKVIVEPADEEHLKPHRITVTVLVWPDRVTVTADGYATADVALGSGEVEDG